MFRLKVDYHTSLTSSSFTRKAFSPFTFTFTFSSDLLLLHQEDSQPLLLCLPSKDFQLGHDDAMISLYQWPMISDQRPARISDQWSVYISSSVLLALNMPSPCLLLLAEASRQLMDPKGCEATETLRSSVSIATCVIIIVIICNAADLLIVTTPISA